MEKYKLNNPFDLKPKVVISKYDKEFNSKLIKRNEYNLHNSEISEIEFEGAKISLMLNFFYESEGLIDLDFQIKVLSGRCEQVNIAFEVEFNDWLRDNYLLMPACAYNGNRFESRKIAYSPKLNDPRDVGIDKPTIISDVPRLNINDGPSFIHERSGGMSVPSAGFYSPKKNKGFLMLTEQFSEKGDNGIKISENYNKTKAVFRIEAPVVRELYKYRITDNSFPSDDIAPDWEAGEDISFKSKFYFFDCHEIQGLFDKWFEVKNDLIKKPEPVKSFPFSGTFPIQEEKFNEQNWIEEFGYYAVGMREIFLQDWQIGWTGGMISTLPLYALGNEKTRERVKRNLDFVLKKGISPSGFFYDAGESKNAQFHWYGGDIRKPYNKDWHLIRKSSDALYYILKHFMTLKKNGDEVKKDWEETLRKVADKFVEVFEKYGEFGNFVDSNTGEIIVGGSTSAGIAPAGLAYASLYFHNKKYLEIAEESAGRMYRNYVANGLTTGGVGDAMQNPDSESAYAILESFAVLFEITGKEMWLDVAERMFKQFSTWVSSYDYHFLNKCTLKELGVRTTGAVWANTQNKHGSPGICTHSGVALLRLFRATGKMEYLELLRDIARFIPQMISHPDRKIKGMKKGWMTERVSTTDWFEGIGELMYGSTWAETSLMLTTLEIPSVYVIKDKGFVYNIDALDAEMEGEKLRIKNFSITDIKARIMIENSEDLKISLGEMNNLDNTEINIPAGEEVVVSL